MAQSKFQKIALLGREGVPGVPETLSSLLNYLNSQPCTLIIEANTAKMVSAQKNISILPAEQLPEVADLLIVVGGDGSLLSAAHISVNHKLPVLGINRGRLGFLTDIHPNDLEQIGAILQGHYLYEERFLLQAQFPSSKNQLALNDVVLLPGDMPQMIEFDIFVNNQLICHHRADGMIIATPTGSTAYALSGGGPILYPDLDAVVLVPMFPHTLSSRPIVISNKSIIKIKISKNNDVSPYISCDGLTRLSVQPGDEIIIQKYPKLLQLIHPLSYNYFHTLREKLHWEKQAMRT